MSKDVVLKAENLEKTYKSGGGTLAILKGLNMELCCGERCVIVGASGSGKTTLLNIIGTLDRPTAGRVTLGGEDVTDMSEAQLVRVRRHTLGMIFQSHYLLKDFSALENVMLPGLIVGAARRDASARAEQLLRDAGLGDRLHHLPGELSGGECQRVAVARSLINDPELILADEPTGSLDPANASSVADLLFSQAARYGKTLLLVTHDMQIARRAQVIYTLLDGRLVRGIPGEWHGAQGVQGAAAEAVRGNDAGEARGESPEALS